MLFHRNTTYLECTGRSGVTYRVTGCGREHLCMIEAERAGTVHRAVMQRFPGSPDAACALALALCEAGADPEELTRFASGFCHELTPV